MLIEAGAVSRKNRNAALIKNLFTTAIAATAWWMWGYGLAFGSPELFVGNNGNFYGAVGFEDMPKDHYLQWVIQFAYCTVVASIYQGALAERTYLAGYLFMSLLVAGFIYPIILAWTWGQGWLAQKGFQDFAGTGVIHLIGGTVGVWGAIVLGKRRSLAK